jgi:hypothetical protein
VDDWRRDDESRPRMAMTIETSGVRHVLCTCEVGRRKKIWTKGHHDTHTYDPSILNRERLRETRVMRGLSPVRGKKNEDILDRNLHLEIPVFGPVFGWYALLLACAACGSDSPPRSSSESTNGMTDKKSLIHMVPEQHAHLRPITRNKEQDTRYDDELFFHFS